MEDRVPRPGPAGVEDDREPLALGERELGRQPPELDGAEAALLVGEDGLIAQAEPALVQPGPADAAGADHRREGVAAARARELHDAATGVGDAAAGGAGGTREL